MKHSELSKPSPLKDQLCFPLYATSRLLTRLYQPHLTPLGITYTQYLVLLLLWERSPRTVFEIGTQTFLQSNTLTPLLKKLEAARLVKRTRSAVDERVVQISLTAEGEALQAKAAAVPQQLAAGVHFSTEKSVALKTLLDELMQELSGKSLCSFP